MKSICSFSFFLLVLIGSIAFTACNPNELLPVLTTTEVSAITQTTATSGGNITSDAGSSVTARGVCWSTKANPTIADSKTSDGAGVGSFTSSITGLAANTTYFVRAYATTSVGTAYGSAYQITTDVILPPVLTTIEVTAITQTAAASGGNITSDGGSSVTARGVCWATTTNPTIAGSKTSDGAGVGTFPSSITGLAASTTYYVRAYATTSVGTAYGNEKSFISNPDLAYGTMTDIDGNVYHTINIGTQTWMAENLKTTKYKDGTSIPNVTDSAAWINLSTPAYCWYNNDAATYKNTYGALYNWYAVNTGKLVPTGWHVPTDAEWTTLTNYVTANLGTSINVAKALAAATDWTIYSTTGTIGCDLTLNNSTGFSALPGGNRGSDNGAFVVGYYGNWWSSTEYLTYSAWSRTMSYRASNVYRNLNYKHSGFSVRCVRDN